MRAGDGAGGRGAGGGRVKRSLYADFVAHFRAGVEVSMALVEQEVRLSN